MIVEMRTYTFRPGAAPTFFKIYEAKALDLQRSILGNLIGYFTSEFGELNQTVHLWGYDGLDDRRQRRQERLVRRLVHDRRRPCTRTDARTHARMPSVSPLPPRSEPEAASRTELDHNRLRWCVPWARHDGQVH